MNVFDRNNISTFQWEDLHGKTLEIYHGKNEEIEVVVGRDIKTGVRYVLHDEIINEPKRTCITERPSWENC